MPMNFSNGLNSLLPDDVVIHACEQMPGTFHARFDVTSKRYRYHLLNRPIATGHRPPVRLAHSHFEGTGSPRSHTVRTVSVSTVKETGGGSLTYDIAANGFLRFMVRNIVGTLVEVGLGKIPVEKVPEILQSRDRSCAGATAPPRGLFLVDVSYPPK
jgi:tRNA pseudouridine38-40 synthase